MNTMPLGPVKMMLSFTEEEIRQIEKAAESEGKNVYQWVRDAAVRLSQEEDTLRLP